MIDDILKEILSEEEMDSLDEIMNHSIDPKMKLEDMEKTIAYSDYFSSRILKIMLKLKRVADEVEIDFDSWCSEEIHEVPYDYNGKPELLKVQKDYERELKRKKKYKEQIRIIKHLHSFIKILEMKHKELENSYWKVKSMIEIYKLRQDFAR